MERKILVFDMDGTIADFYGVNGWLDDLKASNPRPYILAKPLYDMNKLNRLLLVLKAFGWEVVVTSWLARNSSKEFDKLVREAKLDWLDDTGFPYDEVHLVKYGTTKANCTRKKGGFQILFDDNEQVRKGWSLGQTVDATQNIMDKIEELVIAEIDSL